MTRKKIGIYCTAIWGNNNKTHCRRHPMPSPLDLGCAVLPHPGRRTDKRTSRSAGTNMPSQFIDLGNVQRNMPTGTWSAWKRTREDPARLEWVQTAARSQQSHLPPTRGCQTDRSWLPGTGRSCQPGLAGTGGLASPHWVNPAIAPAVPQPEHFLKQTRPAAICEQPCISGLRGLSCQLEPTACTTSQDVLS